MVEEWLEEAGFVDIRAERHLRNKRRVLAEQERELRVEVRGRYPFITESEVDAAIARMRAAASDEWVDPRPTWIIVAEKPRRSGGRAYEPA